MRQIAAKRDQNEPRLVKYLERVGAKVHRLDSGGIPDLLVGWYGLTLLLEVKTTTGKLTSYQIKFFDEWRGQADIVRSIKDIKEVLRRIMPIYVYECQECGKFEVKQRYADDPLVVCPTCKKDIQRVIQKVGVIYLVDGFTKRSRKNE